MRVLQLIASIDPSGGGPIEGVINQAKIFAGRGILTDVVTLDRPDDLWIAECPLKVIPLGIRSASYKNLRRHFPWLRYSYSPHLVQWLRNNLSNYDVVIVNGLWNYIALGAWRALSDSNIPYFVFTHGMLDPWFRKTYPLKHFTKQILWWLSEGLLLQNARAVLFTSEDERTLAHKAFWPYRVNEKVVGFGTTDVVGDPERQVADFHKAVPAIKGRKFLLFLSRIHPKKGCDLLLEAFASVVPGHPNLHLVIGGPDQIGWTKHLKAQADALGIAERVHWPGMLKGNAKWGAFRAADAFVLPSHQENFGVVVAEALACGTPVLITNRVNIWREIEQCDSGFVDEDTVEGVHRVLSRFLSLEPQVLEEMRKHARLCYKDHFNIESTAIKLIEILQSATSAPKGSHT